MYRIDNSSAIGSIPTPASPGTPGYWTNGDPVHGVAPTIIDADWLNRVQEELMAIVVAGGVTPSKTTYNQVLTALNTLYGSQSNVFTGGTTGGTANAQTLATVVPAATSFTNGQSVVGTAGATNTGSMTFSAGGETALTVKKDSGAGLVNLIAGDVLINNTVIFTKNIAATCWVLTAGFPLGTAAYKTASDNTKTVLASVNGSTTSGNYVVFSDTTGTISDSGVPVIKKYDSGLQTYTLGGSLTLGHSLGAIPGMVAIRIHCLTAEGGYSIGDELFVNPGHSDGNADNGGTSVVPDATNLNVRMGASGIEIDRKDSGAVFRINSGSWSIRFIAYT